MRLGIIKKMLIMEEREVVKIFLPYIFLSLPRFVADAAPRGAGLVTLDILSASEA